VDLGLRGRTAVVSGSSRGIGRAVAHRLFAEGARVLLASTGPAADEEGAALAAIDPERVGVLDVDMTTAQGASAAVDAARARWGPVHIVVSNVSNYVGTDAVGPHPCRIDDLRPEELPMVMRRLVESCWFLAEAALPDMRAAGFGRIVNISSLVAREVEIDVPHLLSHVARPAAAMLHKLLAARTAGTGTTVNSILPAGTRTERTHVYWERVAAERGAASWEEVADEHYSTLAVRRMGRVEEQAAVVAFLCSARAGSITGQAVLTDGGGSRGVY
jgi:3-oxoacyl-[acyl-carrier protein] reductase